MFTFAGMSKKFYDNDFKLGILGGGQLGRMFIQEAIGYNLYTAILDPDPNAPCKALAHEFHQGSLTDFDTVYQFGKNMDVLTIEIENVNANAMEQLEKEGVVVYPQPHLLKMVQDKGLQKEFYRNNNLPTADFQLITSPEEIAAYPTGFPLVQKLRRGGYDGRGVQILKSADDMHQAFEGPCVLEDLVDIDKEISVIIARNASGSSKTFPLVEMEYHPEANLVEFLFSPSSVSDEIRVKAEKIATDLVDAMGFIGLLAVEMFVTKSGDVLINEIAPRTHNSGHHSLEGNLTSQFEQHLRAILDLPLGDTEIISPAVMVNLLGEEGYTGDAKYVGLEEILDRSGVRLHLYGKKTTKPFRKMGHLTILDKDLEKAKETARWVRGTLKVIA